MTIGATNSTHHTPVSKPSGQSYNAHIAYDDEHLKKKNIHGGDNVHLTPQQQNISLFC